MNVPALVAGCSDDLRRLRRRFHTYPELSLQESGTIAAICAELNRFGIPHREIEKGGVIATVEGALPGKTLLLRAFDYAKHEWLTAYDQVFTLPD